MKPAGLILMLMLCAAAGASAATLDPETPALGQRAWLRLDTAPADSTEWPTGINAALRATDDPAVFEFVPLRVGTVGAALPATGDTVRFSVPETITEVRPEFLRPIESVGEITPQWGLTIALALLVLGLIAAGVLAWFARRRRGAEAIEGPLEPAEVVALRELSVLEREHLVEDGRFEEFYVRGSHILREYAGRRFALPVLDYTTSETLDSMRQTTSAESFVPMITPLLNAADEVKFARHQPERSDGEYWLREARNFVELTTPVTEPETEDDASSGGQVAEVSA